MQTNNKWIKFIEFNKDWYLNFFNNENLSIFNENKNSPYKHIFIIGENGTGKTLFLNSLQYCLYGDFYSKYRYRKHDILVNYSIPTVGLKITLNDNQIIGCNNFKIEAKFRLSFGKFDQFELDGGGSHLLEYLSKTINVDINKHATQYLGFSYTTYDVGEVPEIIDENKKEAIIENWKNLGLYYSDFGCKIDDGKKYICLNGGTKYDHELELVKSSPNNYGKKYDEVYNSFSDGETSILNFSMIDFNSEIYHLFYDEFGLFLNPYQKTKIIDYLFNKSVDNKTQYFITTNSITTTASVIEHIMMQESDDTLLLLFSKNDSGYVNIHRYAYDIKSKSIINLDNNENIFLLNPISINAINYKLFKVPNYIYFLELINTIKNSDKYREIKGSNEDNKTLTDLAGKEKIRKIINDFKYFESSKFVDFPEELISTYRNTIAHNKWNTKENIESFKFKYNDTGFLKQMIMLLEEIFIKINDK